MFTRTPTDIIKGLRKGKVDRTSFLTTVFSEIREEVKSAELIVKANAIHKLFVLSLEGYDMQWACFYMLELMSSQKFSHKRIGFLAASHSFAHNQDILMLTTNLFKRESANSNYLETSLAVNCLACIINADLARDLLTDFTSLITTSRPILRKKVTILFFKIFLNYPESLNSAFERIAERLRDDNPSVVLGAVNTIFEVARKNPQYVLFTVRSLHDLLLSTTSNWLLIKLIKLFTILCKVEPRLVKKMVEPIYKILQSNAAKSVEFECIRCITEVFSDFQHMTALAINKLQGFLDSNDLNLRYLGLQGLFLMITKQISVSEDYRSYVVESMASTDNAIRVKGLELLKIMTTKDNLVDTVRNLLHEISQTERSESREDMIGTVIFVVSRDCYELVQDFKWMFQVLCALAEAKTVTYESQLSGIMLDVITRVDELIDDIAEDALQLLEKFESLKSERCELLAVLWFIIGEASLSLSDDKAELAHCLLNNDRWEKLDFPESVPSAMVSAAFKLLIRFKDTGKDLEAGELKAYIDKMQTSSKYIEVQERTTLYSKLLDSGPEISNLKSAISVKLQPVHPGAQGLIALPELLQTPIEVKESELMTRKEDGTIEYHYFRDDDMASHEDLAREAKARLKQKSKDPFYLKETKPKKKKKKAAEEAKTEEAEPQGSVVEPRLPEASPTRTYKVNRGAALPS
mmetsp:Transcript_24027/g.42681  ORF Transcript_24027/g.42681 Transcript_24027/m.42681 type:complete len:692 (+) Transcript_24027:1763-3838(+)|eukprot:CAMPEP_0204898318 /NCGR_PEP_ID=MMETSP1397-20131031/1217_1 /ASSEMBLY_ACC=CAM_ASM_000891 /TAXON_ID=49980 /ORGANISM="Climacostomum Climacostomum virens, Strain Stock W-24" /LENGTH=691 /DNA_ID=CAMNT_0052066149 /DNA_START=1067 /DNA_END=3145 /DNA_ORIENTATION=+